MKLLNVELEAFVNFLMEESLNGKQSRMRTRFCKLLSEQIKLIKDEEHQLIIKYCKKENDGTLKTKIDEQQREVYDIENTHLLNNDIKELYLEEYILDNTEEKKELFLTIKNIVENTQRTFKGNEALEYDRFCEIVETIQY